MFTTGHVSVLDATLNSEANGGDASPLAFGTPVEVVVDHGDGWPLVLANPDTTAEIGYVNADFVSWNAPQTNPSPPAGAPSAAPTTAGQKYTNDPLELPVVRTAAPIGPLVEELHAAWPELNEGGARTMAAQYWLETQGGQHCYDWNFGNRKAWRTDQCHMFLRNVWECIDAGKSDALIAAANGLARYATADEIKTHGWKCLSARVVVFSPPHNMCRFLAYPSLSSAVADWCGYMKTKDGILDRLNAADVDGFAQILKAHNYYTSPQAVYAAGLSSGRVAIDHALA